MVKDKKTKKQKKDYFEIVFILISISMFLLLIVSISWLKNSLFQAKDQVAVEFLDDHKEIPINITGDSLVSVKDHGSEDLRPVLVLTDTTLGQLDAKIKIFYWSDFACSFCLEQENILKKVYDKFNEKVLIVRKDYPDVNSLESFSFQASKAARCANLQGKFWNYNELLYNNKDQFIESSNQLFIDLAQTAQLNLEDFRSCLQDKRIDQAILNNVSEAEDLGIMGLPYIYINDKDFLGDIGEEELKALIEIELKK